MECIVSQSSDQAMGLKGIFFDHPCFGRITNKPFTGEITSVSGEMAEIFPGQMEKPFPGNIPYRTDHHLIGIVIFIHKPPDILPVKGPHMLRGSQYISPDGMSFEDELFKIIKDQFRGRIVIGVDLIDNDILLPF